MSDYENIKLEINKEQPLEDIVNVLESKGYGVVNHYLRNHNFIVATVNYCGALNFDYWSENIKLVTLAEIKEMKMTKSFEQVLDQEKNELTEALILFGEGKRVNKTLADLEMNRPEFYKFYEAGQQSKQAEIDELHKRIDDLITSIDWHIEDCELWLSMNKNDYWKGGQLEILKAIKKRFSK